MGAWVGILWPWCSSRFFTMRRPAAPMRRWLPHPVIFLCMLPLAYSFSSLLLRPGGHTSGGSVVSNVGVRGGSCLRGLKQRARIMGSRRLLSATSSIRNTRLSAIQSPEGEQDGEANEVDETAEAEVLDPGLWEDWTDIEVKAATVMWINSLVIGLDLCPFALESMPGLRVVVSNAKEKEQALDVLAEEMGYLVDKPINKPATTLVVFPLDLFDGESFDIDFAPDETTDEEEEEAEDLANMLPQDPNFVTFMQFAREGSEISQDLYGDDPQTEILLLTFHPNSTFSDRPFDPAEYALRSPFPTIHLLRGPDVRKAERRCDSQNKTTEDIAIANEARLRGVGYTELSTALEECYLKAKGLAS